MDEQIRQHVAEGRYLEAFDIMLGSYQNKVFRLACGMLRNEAMAQDICQEVFMKVWKALPSYRGDASPSSWIYTITRNTCLSELKRHCNRKNVSIEEKEVELEVEQAALTHEDGSTAGQGMDIETLLNDLPDHYRQVIKLFYLEQKSYEDVAAMLDIPLGTVKTYLHRAKKELLKNTSRKEVYA